MRAVRAIVMMGVVAAAGASCGSQPEAAPPPFKTELGVQRLMQLVIDPAADQLWTSVSTTVTEKGVDEVFPKSDEEWEAVRYGAAVLVESGNLLMLGGRARDTEDWSKFSVALSDAASTALKAAEARNVEAVFKTGGDIYQACTNCHQKYWADDPRSQLSSN